jgi:hypothetical protein
VNQRLLCEHARCSSGVNISSSIATSCDKHVPVYRYLCYLQGTRRLVKPVDPGQPPANMRSSSSSSRSSGGDAPGITPGATAAAPTAATGESIVHAGCMLSFRHQCFSLPRHSWYCGYC